MSPSCQSFSNQVEADRLARSRASAWLASGFFPRHRHAAENGPLTWPRPERIEPAYDAVLEGGMVALVGPRGTGKTQLAADLALRVLRDAGRTPLYHRAQDYFAAIKRSFDDADTDPRRKARNAGMLVLDEVQERYESAFEDLELTSLLDHRYGNMRPTVLIANLTPDELAKSLGTSVVSRIQETGLVVVCDWPSFRAKVARR